MNTDLCLLHTAVTLFASAVVALPAAAAPSRSMSDATSHDAPYGTNKVRYLTVGQGPRTIVFVHCWAGNSGFWREQVPALADRARLILLDLPGHGRSDKPRTAYTMDYFAGAVLAVMRDARVEKAVLVGHSMGTPVICRVHSQAPDKVAALVAVDGFLRRPSFPPEQGEQIRAMFSSPDYRAHTTNFIHSMFPQPGTEPLRDRVLSEILDTPQFVMSSSMDGMFAPDQPDWDLKRVKEPVLALNAENPMWTTEYKEYVHSLSSKTEYRTLSGVGHWLMLEKPADFNSDFTDMLRKFGLIGE